MQLYLLFCLIILTNTLLFVLSLQKLPKVRKILLNLSEKSTNKENYVDDVFSLNSIRGTLIRQEETIIFALIERAQFKKNNKIYNNNGWNLKKPDSSSASLLDWMFIQTESVHSQVRRYTSPDEHPFFKEYIDEPILPSLEFPKVLIDTKSQVDVNNDIMNWYINKIIERLCEDGDDEQYGSSVTCDVTAMQSISRRIHYGKYVAESKYLSDPDTYTKLVSNNNVQGVLDLLTNVEVERNVLRRAYKKASTYGQDIGGNRGGEKLIEPSLIADIYRDMIIPLTKDVEIRYLYHRIGNTNIPPVEEYLHLCSAPFDAFDNFEL